MRKAFFFSNPLYGHVNPSLALVAELVRRGERVVYYTTEEFRERVEFTGAEYRSYGDIPEITVDVCENPLKGAAFAAKATLDVLPKGIDEVRAEKPDYIIHDQLALWGQILVRELKAPGITLCPSVAPLKGIHFGLFRYDVELVRFALRGLPYGMRFFRLQRQLREEHGWTGGLVGMFACYQGLNLVTTSKYFHPKGDQYPDHFKFIGPQLTDRLEKDLLDLAPYADKTVLYISLGSVYHEQREFYLRCIEAFRNERDMHVLMSVGRKVDIASLGEIPENFTVRNVMPQLQILKRADVFLTHGGQNSTTEGLSNGVPLVVVPLGGDQLLLALRTQQLGAGRYLPLRKTSPAGLRGAVRRVLDDASYRANAEKVAESYRATGGAVQAADEILAYVEANGKRG